MALNTFELFVFPAKIGHALFATKMKIRNIIRIADSDVRNLTTQLDNTVDPVPDGIYFMDDFGIRSEINVYITKDRKVVVPGEPRQQELVAILK